MDVSLLKSLGQTAGIGGIALGVVLLLFRDLLKKFTPSGLTGQQWFRIVLTLMILVWSLGAFGIAAWVYAENSKNNIYSSASPLNTTGSPSASSETKIDVHGDVSGVVAGRDVYLQGSPLTDRVDELIGVLNQRAERIKSQLQQYYKYAAVGDFLSKFEALHAKHIGALKQGHLVQAHEIFLEINELSSSLESNEFWKRHNAEHPDIVYRLRSDVYRDGPLIRTYIGDEAKRPPDDESFVEEIKPAKSEKDAANFYVQLLIPDGVRKEKERELEFLRSLKADHVKK